MESVKNEFMKNNWFAEAANKNQIAINTNFIGEQQGLNQNLEDKKIIVINSLYTHYNWKKIVHKKLKQK